jgi:hypothetical protein
MKQRAAALLALVALLGCSQGGGGNDLSGSLAGLYDLSFTDVHVIMQGSSVAIQYVNGTSAYPAIVVVDVAHIVNVAGSSIDLTQLDSGQPRGVLQSIDTVTTNFPIQQGTLTFNQVPQLGQTLSGTFAITVSNPPGYTLDGDFSGTVVAP